jgi:hypothetical protein
MRETQDWNYKAVHIHVAALPELIAVSIENPLGAILPMMLL